MRIFRNRQLAVILCLLFVGCQANKKEEPQLRRYPLKGKIVSVNAAGHQAMIDHEEIPGLMAAMRMAYPVKDDAALQTLQAGDEITAEVVVDAKNSFWVEKISVVKKAEPKGE